MAGVETWRRPASDDINPDALEYLLSSQDGMRASSPPWVDIISEPEPAPNKSPEMMRLQTKVEMLAGEVDLLAARLQQSNLQIGFLLAQLAERDSRLEQVQLQVPGRVTEFKVRSGRANLWRCSEDFVIYGLMIAFAWAVLMTLLT